MSDAAARLPNLYQLLSLAPLESDHAKIAAAIKRLQKAAGQDAPAARDEVERSQKIVALAQKYLLDPQRKLAYDQQWKAVYQTSPSGRPSAVAAAQPTAAATPSRAATSASPAKAAASSTVAVPTEAMGAAPVAATWDYAQLNQLLPQGDPQAAFDMASFLRSGGESRDPLAAQADLDKLMALLSNAAGNADAAVIDASVMAVGMEQRPDYQESVGHSLGLPPSPRGGQSQSPGGGLARRMRQRKQRALLLGGTAIAVGLGGLVLLGIYLFRPKTDPTSTQLAQVGQPRPAAMRGSGLPKVGLDNVPAATDTAQKPLPNATPVGSGLPKPGEGAMNLQVDPSAMPATMPERKPEAKPEAMIQPSPQPSATPTGPNATPTTTPTTAPTPDPPAEPVPEPEPAMDTKPEGEPQPAPAAEPELSTAEKRAWQKQMAEAKQLIGKQDFEAAEKQLGELKADAKTSQQRGQLERLEQVLGFVKDIRQAIVDAIASLGPAETFKVGGSTVASFVEGDEERLTVRVSGRSRSYLLSELPVALGLGLVDLKLDVEHASSLARKGAYILTHPKGDAALERGKRMLQEAADAGAISSELAKFYEDDYSLSKDAK